MSATSVSVLVPLAGRSIELPDTLEAIERYLQTTGFAFDVNRNTTNNLLDANQGYVLSGHLEQAGKWLFTLSDLMVLVTLQSRCDSSIQSCGYCYVSC